MASILIRLGHIRRIVMFNLFKSITNNLEVLFWQDDV